MGYSAEQIDELLKSGTLERLGIGSRRACYRLPEVGLCVKCYRSDDEIAEGKHPGRQPFKPLSPSVVKEIHRCRFDEKRNTVIGLTAASAVASAALTLVPDDTCTPIAEQLSAISKDFSFVIAALLLGPLWAGITAALADFLGAMLFPVGPYFPGFTLTAFLMGACYGLFLHRKQSLVRVLGAVAVHQFVLSLLLNTLWISLLYDSPFGPLLVSRLPQCALLTAVQVVVIQALVRLLPQLKRSIS